MRKRSTVSVTDMKGNIMDKDRHTTMDQVCDDASFTIINRTISLIAFGDIVDRRCCEYMEKYHVKPQFIKLPMWIYKIILKYHDFVRVDRYTQKETVCGLALCPTISIEEPSDIEVF